MAKKFFRFLRGELNGYYLKAVGYSPNNLIDRYYNKLFCYFKNMQLQTDSANELENISMDDLQGVASFCGVAQIVSQSRTTEGEIRFTNSYISDDEEMATKGLYNKSSSSFTFLANPDESTSETLKASFVPDGAEILGYISENVDMYDENGNFDESKVLSVPPQSGSYTCYYGQKYIHLSDSKTQTTPLTKDTLLKLIIAVQNVKNNGANVKSLCDITSLFLEDFGTITLVNNNAPYVTVEYIIDYDAPAQDKTLKIAIWKNIILNMFQQVLLVEVQGENNE